MEFSVTKLSQNGQIVIPSEIRNAAKLKPATKFLVMMRGDEIILKQLQLEDLEEMPVAQRPKSEAKKKTTKRKTKTTISVYT